MKLIIDQTLEYIAVTDISSTEENMADTADEFHEFAEICDKFSIHYMLDLRDDMTVFNIYPQKITLSEQDMNTLFFEVLWLYDVVISYAALGSTGCDFAMRINQKKV